MKRPSVASDHLLGSTPVGGQVSGRVVRVDDSAGMILMKVAVTFSPNTFRLGEEVVLAQAKHLSTIEHDLPVGAQDESSAGELDPTISSPLAIQKRSYEAASTIWESIASAMQRARDMPLATPATHSVIGSLGYQAPYHLAGLTGLTVDPMAQADEIWKALNLEELTGSLPTGQPVSESRASASDPAEDNALLIVANEMLSHLNREVRDLAEELKGVLDRLDRQAAPDDPRMDQANG